MKMKKTWTGKKSPTNPEHKEKHEIRKYKLLYLDELRQQEREQEIRDYIHNANKQIQE
jgi:hypothetical protein